MAVINSRPVGGAAKGICRGRAALAATRCGRRRKILDVNAALCRRPRQ